MSLEDHIKTRAYYLWQDDVKLGGFVKSPDYYNALAWRIHYKLCTTGASDAPGSGCMLCYNRTDAKFYLNGNKLCRECLLTKPYTYPPPICYNCRNSNCNDNYDSVCTNCYKLGYRVCLPDCDDLNYDSGEDIKAQEELEWNDYYSRVEPLLNNPVFKEYVESKYGKNNNKLVNFFDLEISAN